MTDKQTICGYVQTYRQIFPTELATTQLLADYLDNNTEGTLYDRKNFNGHITASAFVINPARNAMLLLRHKSLERWLQPGGHVEPGDASLTAASLREAVEETGIPAHELELINADNLNGMPFDIDSHYIPANPRKAEDGHYHHDHRYVYVYTGTGDNAYNKDEATGLKWVSLDELIHDDTFAAVIQKIRKYL